MILSLSLSLSLSASTCSMFSDCLGASYVLHLRLLACVSVSLLIMLWAANDSLKIMQPAQET